MFLYPSRRVIIDNSSVISWLIANGCFVWTHIAWDRICSVEYAVRIIHIYFLMHKILYTTGREYRRE